MLVNCSNHPNEWWSEKQRREAVRQWGEITDVPFPNVDPYLTEAEVHQLAEQMKTEILALHPAAVMCQGEFTLCHALTSELLRKGVPVVAACSQRCVHEVCGEY